MLGMGRTDTLRNAHRRPTGVLAAFALSVLLSWGALASTGCNTTPTLPLPPPIAMADAPDEQGYALVRGEAKARSYVSVLNENTDEGVITRAAADGKFQTKIAAEPGDMLTVWQIIDQESSEPYYAEVPAPR